MVTYEFVFCLDLGENHIILEEPRSSDDSFEIAAWTLSVPFGAFLFACIGFPKLPFFVCSCMLFIYLCFLVLFV